ncbi:MAG TPA: DoxX family protein [Ignavibacteriaceae bacterium]
MIKNIFDPGKYSSRINITLLFLRITIGIFMLTHGIGKFSLLIGNDPIQFADPIGIGESASLALAVFAELFCSILLIFGIATRFVVIPLLTTMLVAILIVHAGDVFQIKEMALLYFCVYIAIAIAGAGKISIDSLIYKKIIH